MLGISAPKRDWLDSFLDRVRFSLDTFPALDYQPLPWFGIERAGRAAGVESRWEAISSFLAGFDIESATDIGCNVGFFAINLARSGIATLGIEGNAKQSRILNYAIRRLQLPNIGSLFAEVTPATVKLMVPPSDCILFLSVWHHVVRKHGLAEGERVLAHIWKRTNQVLFFETGENEMPSEWNLPRMEPDAKRFLHAYLEERCPGSRVVHLGQHEASAPDSGLCHRNLFALVKIGTSGAS